MPARNSPRPRAPWITAAIAIGLVATPARAEPPEPASLGWVRETGAETCIGTTPLAQAVEARLGRPALVSASRARVSVEGRITKAEGQTGWRVSLTVADATGKILGTRTLSRDTADCRALDEDIVLTIALLIDPDAARTAPPAPETPKPPTTAPSPAVSSVPAPPNKSGPPPPRQWNTAFLAGPALSFGSLPNVGVGAELRVLVTPAPFFSFQVGGSVWAPQTATLGDAGGQFFQALGVLSLCPLSGLSFGFRYAACAGVEAGAMRAGGTGFPLTEQHGDPLVNALLEARVVRRLIGPLAASFGAGLSVPFLRHQYYYLDAAGTQREVFLSSPLAGNLDLLLGFDL